MNFIIICSLLGSWVNNGHCRPEIFEIPREEIAIHSQFQVLVHLCGILVMYLTKNRAGYQLTILVNIRNQECEQRVVLHEGIG